MDNHFVKFHCYCGAPYVIGGGPVAVQFTCWNCLSRFYVDFVDDNKDTEEFMVHAVKISQRRLRRTWKQYYEGEKALYDSIEKRRQSRKWWKKDISCKIILDKLNYFFKMAN